MVARRDFAGAAAATTLAADINATATSIAIASGTGWPTGANGEFYICIDRGHAGEEKCLVLSRSGTALTLASAAKRGKDGTAAASHTAGVSVEHVGTAADLDEANAFVATPGVSGDIAASAPGDTAAAGGTGKWADAAHRHAREAFGAAGDVVASAPGDTAAAGSTGKVADAGHRHAREAATTGTVYFVNLGAAAGQTFTTKADATGLTAITFTADGATRYRLHLHAAMSGGNAGDTGFLELYEGATRIGLLWQLTIPTTAGAYICDGFWEWVPAGGSHTYKIRGSGSGAGVVLNTQQANNMDTYLSVEAIGT